ncbi:hypothetical protein L1987_05719 [Smallanthus sonchifolius]|uniref:Uncharacterized protein n=1 Tax=Smallanthus sonchifolius TaxID=185202 RepID=A0ACB9JWE6_9ASTR|nr:hypothetical protein L1987_05719 [Smallanthus sonchifolius]
MRGFAETVEIECWGCGSCGAEPPIWSSRNHLWLPICQNHLATQLQRCFFTLNRRYLIITVFRNPRWRSCGGGNYEVAGIGGAEPPMWLPTHGPSEPAFDMPTPSFSKSIPDLSNPSPIIGPWLEIS